MTSNINPSAINALFPVAGINQSSQGFRTNYSNIQNQFVTASLEITNLQASLFVVATNVNTLTLVSSINSLTGTVTLALTNIADVNISGNSAKQVLIWNGSNWTNSLLATVAYTNSYNDLSNLPTISGSLSGLSDMVITGPILNQALVYNGTHWINQSIFTLVPGTYSSATITVDPNGWINTVSSTDLSGYLLLDNIINVTSTLSSSLLSSPYGVFNSISSSLAQFMTIAGDGSTVYSNVSDDGKTIILSTPAQASLVPSNLAGLTDVLITSLAANQVLNYNGVKWENITPDQFSLTGLAVTSALGYTPFNAAAGGIIAGGIVFQNSVYAMYGVAGNASTATNLQIPLQLVYTADATGSGSFTGSEGIVSIALTLVSSGVTAGTYTSVQVNAKGLVTLGGSLTSLDVTNALGATLAAKNGIATLDNNGQLTTSQIPAGLVGALVYIGPWNASTNIPPLANGTGTKGNYYVVSNAGNTSINGINQWNLGDTIIYDGAVWDKIDGIPNEVISVNGQTGIVTISSITGNASTASQLASAQTIAISGDATGYTSFDGSIPVTIALTLKNTGNVGTYNQVTTDAQGRVVSGSLISYLTGITGSMVTLAIGYTPYDSTNPAGYITGTTINNTMITDALAYTPVNKTGDTMSGTLTNSSGFVGPLTGNASTANAWSSAMTLTTSGDATGSVSFDGSTSSTIALSLVNTGSVGTYNQVITDAQGRVTNGSFIAYLTTISGSQVTTALGYTPYDSTNPAGYITGVSLPTNVSQLTNDIGYITGTTITESMVTTALGYTPVNNAGDTMSGNLTVVGSITDAGEQCKIDAITTSLYSVTEDYTSYQLTVNANSVIELITATSPGSSLTNSMTILLIGDGVNTATFDSSSGIIWDLGVVQPMNNGAGKYTVFTFIRFPGIINWFGARAIYQA